MERPAKRIRFTAGSPPSHDTNNVPSQAAMTLNPATVPNQGIFEARIPSPTINLASLQRSPNLQPRNAAYVVLPREPDATVTASALAVAVEGLATSIIAAPSVDTAIVLPSLGTVTVDIDPHSTDSSSSTTESSETTTAPSLSSTGIFSATNGTSASSTERTVTVTETSTYRVSYSNGTFILPTRTRVSSSSRTDSFDSTSTDSDFPSTYYFGMPIGSESSYSTTVYGDSTGAAGIAATETSSNPAASSSAPPSKGDDGPGLSPQQAQTVGGVVGGIAGVALVLVIILYVLRWYRKRLKGQGLLADQTRDDHNEKSHGAIMRSDAGLSHNSRSSLFPAFAASSLNKLRPRSEMTDITTNTATTTNDSEKGFQRISGRKLAPALTTGGNGFVEPPMPYGASYDKDGMSMSSKSFVPGHSHDLSDTSFYRDSNGVYMSPSSQHQPRSVLENRSNFHVFPSTSAVIPQTATHDFAKHDGYPPSTGATPTSSSRLDGYAMMRSSPARTPVTQSPNSSSIRLPIQAPVTMDADVPDMPLSPKGYGPLTGQAAQVGHIGGAGPGEQTGTGLSPFPRVHNLAQQRMPSRLSARSGSGSTGRFREELI